MAFRIDKHRVNTQMNYTTTESSTAVLRRLLEFNRPAHSPWLTVPLDEEEIVIQDANERNVFSVAEELDVP